MPSPAFILMPQATGWRIALVQGGRAHWSEVACDVAPEARAEAAEKELRRLRYAGGGIMLALGPDWCIPVRLASDEVGPSLLFRLEERLPLAAEEMVADQSGELAVAARLAPLKELVEALEACGIVVQSITPAALLGAQRLSTSASEMLALSNHASIELVLMRQGRPAAWSSADPESLRMHVELGGAERIRATDAEAVAQALGRSDIEPISADLGQEMALAGAEVLAGRQAALIELRRDALGSPDKLRQHRSALNALLAGAAIALLLLAAALYVRGWRYAQQAAAHEEQARSAFAKAYPGWDMPADVTMVLQAEHRRMTQQREALPAEARSSALPVLARLMAQLPGSGRYRIESAMFGPAEFELTGRATAAGEIAAIEAALSHAGAEMTPAESSQSEDALWTFTLRGRLR